jgi:L-threonylcarbamoyladenylate synthase
MTALAEVVEHLRTGGLAALPTETGYMLAANATLDDAVRTVFRAKKRPFEQPVHVAVSSLAMAERYAAVGKAERRIIGELCPGPVTTICTANGSLAAGLVEWKGTVGLRVPASPVTLHVVATLGVPVTATSLNLHGLELGDDVEVEVEALSWSEGEVVHGVRVDGTASFERPSTLVRVGPAGEVEILREGPVTEAQIVDLLGC